LEFGENGVGGSGPDERFAGLVVVGHEAIDLGDQVPDRVERAAPDGLVGDVGEETLDQVEPGAVGGNEMEMPAPPSGEPGLDLGMLVGGVVVEVRRRSSIARREHTAAAHWAGTIFGSGNPIGKGHVGIRKDGVRRALDLPLRVRARSLGSGPAALADPILECGLLAGENIEVGDCLRTQLYISHRAMIEAQELALGTARQLDERTGTEVAVLGLEASQQAWETYRDVECQTLGVFAGDATPAETAQLAVRSGSSAHVPTPYCVLTSLGR
jgi:uncharacterized protein YecT (DUF1311 family)